MNSGSDAPGRLSETDDYEAIRALAMRSGLEDGNFEHIVVAYGFFKADELVACAALRRIGDTFSVEWLSVDEQHRKTGIGRTLVDRVAAEAKALGATRLWALARAPDFFEHIGFRRSSLEASPGPTFAGCVKCPQYEVTCFPKIVVKDL